jgi:hypothetical protein
MTEEVKSYYARFFQYKLGDEDANRILQFKGPAK